MTSGRRAFLGGFAALAVSARSVRAQATRTRLVLPGTGAARVPNAARLKESIVAHQTAVEDAGRVAQEAGVRTLVLSHLVPPDDPEVTESMWSDAARAHFRGRIVLGRDPLEID